MRTFVKSERDSAQDIRTYLGILRWGLIENPLHAGLRQRVNESRLQSDCRATDPRLESGRHAFGGAKSLTGHLEELRIARDPTHRSHINPDIRGCSRVLD